MKIYETHENYGPSNELKFRIRKLCEIAALAKLLGQTELFNQAKSQHDKFVSDYNSVAKTKKKGFWGQFVDNLSWTTSSVTILDNLDNSYEFSSKMSTYSQFSSDKNMLTQLLKKAMKEWEDGRDLMSRYGM